MRLNARVLVIGGAALAGLWFLAAGSAADEEKEAKEIRVHLVKMADAIEQSNQAEAKKQADALKKYELLPIMKQLKLRANGGIGIGPQPGSISPDGIEAKLIGMARKPLPAAQLMKEGDDLAKAAYIMAAIAEIAKDRCPVKQKVGDKDPKDWVKWSEDMHKLSKDVAAAAKAKDPAKLKTVAANLNSNCNSCHTVFRD
jgi:hypothetical protein